MWLATIGSRSIVGVVLIGREFLLRPQTNEHGYRHSYGQASDVDPGVNFIFEEFAQSNFEVVEQHLLDFNRLNPATHRAEMSSSLITNQSLCPAEAAGKITNNV